jgi:hypothetical protein
MRGWAPTVLLKSPLSAVKPVLWAAIVAGGGVLAFRGHFGASPQSSGGSPRRSQGEAARQSQAPIPKPAFASLEFLTKLPAPVPVRPQRTLHPSRADLAPANVAASMIRHSVPVAPAVGQTGMPSSLVLQSQLRSTQGLDYAFDRAFPVGPTVWTSPDAGSDTAALDPQLSSGENSAPIDEALTRGPVPEREAGLATSQFTVGKIQSDQSQAPQAETEAMPDLALVMAVEGTAPLASTASRESGSSDAGTVVTPRPMPDQTESAASLAGDSAASQQSFAEVTPSMTEPEAAPSEPQANRQLPDVRPAVHLSMLELERAPRPKEPMSVVGTSARNFAMAGGGEELVVVAFMHGMELGSLPLHRTAHGQITVRLRDVVDLIQPMIERSEYVRLSSSRHSDRFVSLEKLHAAGINAQYDPVRQEISLSAEQ